MSGASGDKVALVVGGGSGIGHACVRKLASELAEAVIVADIFLPTDPTELTRDLDATIRFEIIDVTDPEQCDGVVRVAITDFGRLDVLVVAAGLNYTAYAARYDAPVDRTRRPTVVETDDHYWRAILDANLTGTMQMDRAAARVMVEQGGGSIVNITSIGAVRAAVGNSAYCVSKAGVWMLTKCLALELGGSGVRVNAVAPGYVETPMTDDLRNNPDLLEGVLSLIPLSRIASAGEIAASVAFLAGDSASYITGSVLTPDGGAGAEFR